MRTLLAQLNPTIGALEANGDKIINALDEARARDCQMVIFPELAIPGYPPEDLLLLTTFIDGCARQLDRIIAASADLIVIVGTVRREGRLRNTAAIIDDGRLVGFQDKMLLPTYDVFDEHRYFETASSQKVWELGGERLGITICEDIWGPGPVEQLAKQNPTLLINISASPYSMHRGKRRLEVVQAAALKAGVPTLYCNQVGANDSLIFDGQSLAVTASGELAHRGASFEEELIPLETLTPCEVEPIDPLEQLFNALTLGVRDYFTKSGFSHAIIGISGGIDSALVAAIAVAALGPSSILGVAMPSRYSSPSSLEDAEKLTQNLGFPLKTISIEPMFATFLQELGPHFEGKPEDATEENLQARIRGMILMALSNKHDHIVLSTGNKSENAMGYATLYGDMCGGLAVINDLPKLMVFELCRWLNRNREVIPKRIIDKPPSAELREGQLDSDALPEYNIVDPVLDDYILHHKSPVAIATTHGLPLPLVQDLVRRIHRNEYKRRQAPPGLRVTEKAFSVGRRFPIVHHWLP
jgi:NAD+ synthase (glutamine-hydrolysing)